MTTKKQRSAVRFCEKYGCEPFTGDIEDFKEVSKYLTENLEYAKDVAWELYLQEQDNLWK